MPGIHTRIAVVKGEVAKALEAPRAGPLPN